MKLYQVKGTVASTRIKNDPFTKIEDITIIVSDIWNEKQAPVMLTIIGSFKNWTDTIMKKGT